VLPIAMADDEEPQARGEPEEDETLFPDRVTRIVDHDAVFIEKGRRGLLERHPVTPYVRPALRSVPFEAKIERHNYIVATASVGRKGSSIWVSAARN